MRANFYHLIAAVTLCWVVVSPRDTFGHADIEIRIADLTKKIEADPANADLYLERGELHRVHEDWESALGDYRRAGELDPALTTVHLARGRMFYESGRPLEAVVELDRFLAVADASETSRLMKKHNPACRAVAKTSAARSARSAAKAEPWRSSDRGSRHGTEHERDRREALVTRARARAALEGFEEAAEDYTRAIATLERHTPEYYLERSEALVRAGLPERALRGIDEGVEKAGHLVTLELRAIELELTLERYDGALARLDTISRWMPEEVLWFRRGEILHRADRIAEARQAYERSLGLIEIAPAERRSTRAHWNLAQRLRSALAEAQER